MILAIVVLPKTSETHMSSLSEVHASKATHKAVHTRIDTHVCAGGWCVVEWCMQEELLTQTWISSSRNSMDQHNDHSKDDHPSSQGHAKMLQLAPKGAQMFGGELMMMRSFCDQTVNVLRLQETLVFCPRTLTWAGWGAANGTHRHICLTRIEQAQMERLIYTPVQ